MIMLWYSLISPGFLRNIPHNVWRFRGQFIHASRSKVTMMIHISNAINMEKISIVALSVHKALRGTPILLKVANENGILIEDGCFHFSGLECNALNAVFSGDPVQQIHIGHGKHIGAVMFASAIENGSEQRVAAIGIIDTIGILSLGGFLSHQESINRQMGSQNRGDKHLIRSRR